MPRSDNCRPGGEEHKLGIKSSSTTAVILSDAKIPVGNLIGNVGDGAKIAFNVLNAGRFKLGASVTGGAKLAIHEAVRYANERHQFNRPISSFGAIKHKLADMYVLNELARSNAYFGAWALSTNAADLPEVEKYFPDVLKIRLLLPGVSELDEQSIPRMGFTDLDMVRESFTNNQMPRIQGSEGADRHLAITRRIMHNDQVIGVILASLNYDFINKSLQAAAVKDGYIELRQAKLVLGSSGERADAGQSESVQTKVANTDWDINYYYAVNAGFAEIIPIAITIAVALLLTLLAFYVGYRRLSGLMTQDLNSVLNACKDILTHKPPGSYPSN